MVSTIIKVVHSFIKLYIHYTVLTVNFEQPVYSVAESERSVEVCIIANTSLLEVNYTVRLYSEDSSAIGKSTLYISAHSATVLPCMLYL